jgi:MFS family permease
VLLAVGPAAVVAGFTPALVFPVLGRIAEEQHVDTGTVTWVITAPFIATAVATPIVGRLADLLGRRRMLMITLATVVVGSLITATTLNFAFFLVGRVLQGCASALYPVIMSTAQARLAGRQMTSAVAGLSGTMGVGGAVGLTVAGLLGGGSDYRPIFWFPVALGLVALLAVLLGGPHDDEVHRGAVDVAGCLLLAAALVFLLLPVSQGARWGFTSPAVLGSAAAGVAAIGAFAVVEQRARRPMVPLRYLRHRGIMITNTLAVLVGGMTFAPLIIVPILVQSRPSIVGDGAAVSPLQTALVYLLPGNLLGVVGAPLGSRLMRRWGARVAMMWVGGIGVAGALAMFLAPGVAVMLILGLFLTAFALYVYYGAAPSLILPLVERADLGIANGMNSLGRWVGSALVTAACSVVLTPGRDGRSLQASDFRWAFLIGVGVTVGISLTAIIAIPSRRSARAQTLASRVIPAGAPPASGAELTVITAATVATDGGPPTTATLD